MSVGQTLWYYVTIPVYDTPSNVKGWIQAKDTKAFTQDKVTQVQSDITVAAGAPGGRPGALRSMGVTQVSPVGGVRE